MDERLRSDIWVAAYVRRCSVQGAAAFVVRRGSSEAGSILIKVNGLDGLGTIYSRAVLPDGEGGWLRSTGSDPVSDRDCEAAIARAAARDPDLWVVEVEDRQHRHFLEEAIQ